MSALRNGGRDGLRRDELCRAEADSVVLILASFFDVSDLLRTSLDVFLLAETEDRFADIRL